MTRSIVSRLIQGLILLLFFATVAPAAQSSPVYVIKKGDTLWGISERFVNDPLYWPNLWAKNPFIGNPHLIYPGQKVRIRDGKLEILPADWQAEQQPLPTPAETVTIKTNAGGEGFITTEDTPFPGTLVDFDDNRLLATEGDTVFAQFADTTSVVAGDRYAIFRKGRAIRHPQTNKVVGHLIEELGHLEIDRLTNAVAVARVTNVVREVKRGDGLRPAAEVSREVELRKADADIEATILGSYDRRSVMGQYDLIYLDQGLDAGLKKGNLLDLTRPRTTSKHVLEGREIELPDRLLGAAVIVDINDKTATALILKSAQEIKPGDKAQTFQP